MVWVEINPFWQIALKAKTYPLCKISPTVEAVVLANRSMVVLANQSTVVLANHSTVGQGLGGTLFRKKIMREILI